MRKMLIIKADDKFDKLFNLLNVMSLPGSIVENFKFFSDSIQSFIEKN